MLDLLQPSVEPLLCLLRDGGFTAQSRELLVADRLRAVLSPLIEAGHLVVIQSPGIDTAEGEAFLGAADLGLVVVTMGRTRPRERRARREAAQRQAHRPRRRWSSARAAPRKRTRLRRPRRGRRLRRDGSAATVSHDQRDPSTPMTAAPPAADGPPRASSRSSPGGGRRASSGAGFSAVFGILARRRRHQRLLPDGRGHAVRRHVDVPDPGVRRAPGHRHRARQVAARPARLGRGPTTCPAPWWSRRSRSSRCRLSPSRPASTSRRRRWPRTWSVPEPPTR